VARSVGRVGPPTTGHWGDTPAIMARPSDRPPPRVNGRPQASRRGGEAVGMWGQRAPRVGRGRGRVTLGGGGSDDATTAPRGGPSQRRALPAAAAVGRADSAPRVLAGSARHARKPRRADRGRRGQAPADATDDAMVLATPPTTVVAARAAVAAEDLVTRGAGRDLPSAHVAAAAAAEAEAPRRALSRSHVGGGGGGHERRRQHLAARYVRASMVPVGWGLLIRMPDATHTLLPNRMNFAATLRCVAPWSLRCAVIAAAALASASTADLTATSVGVTKFWYR